MLSLLVGFMLGVVIRSSAGALVAYFVFSFLLPTLFLFLANSQDWFRDLALFAAVLVPLLVDGPVGRRCLRPGGAEHPDGQRSPMPGPGGGTTIDSSTENHAA